MDKILLENCRILNAREHRSLLKALTDGYDMQYEAQVLTGMRDVEFNLFLDNPDWFIDEGRCIHLPKSAVKKTKVRFKERYIWLSAWGFNVIDKLCKKQRSRDPLEAMDRRAWGPMLKRAAVRAGISDDGIMPKMTRKTWECWLVMAFPHLKAEIFLSQGHTELVALSNYLMLPFNAQDREEMIPYVSGWDRKSSQSTP